MEYEDDYSNYGNEVLYQMCANQPRHDDRNIVYSKLWIIGRAYSATIERGAPRGFNIMQTVDLIVENNLNIDQQIAGIANILRPEMDDIPNILIVLQAHKYFTDMLHATTGLYKRSLASKYLHFHSPQSVFIFDAFANANVRAHINENEDLRHLYQWLRAEVDNVLVDNEYASFYCRCLVYRNFLEDGGLLLTPRGLDMMLLGYANLHAAPEQ